MRPRKTQEQWSELIDQQQQSGLTILQFCQEHDIGFASFGKWKKRLCADSTQSTHAAKKADFTPVSVTGWQDHANVVQSTATITLNMGGGMTLTIVNPSLSA